METDLLEALDRELRQEAHRQQNRSAAVAEALELWLQVWRRCGGPIASWGSWRVHSAGSARTSLRSTLAAMRAALDLDMLEPWQEGE